jgi:hypothetical protein
MRPIRLARIAAEAEVVRLRGFVSRIVTRIIFGVLALVFVMGALVFAHIAGWYGLRIGLSQGFLATTGELGGADLLAAAVLGFLAYRSTPGRVEVEALDVRRKAIQAIGSAFSLAQLAMPALRIAANLQRRRRRV